jgi:hypothetical protein
MRSEKVRPSVRHVKPEHVHPDVDHVIGQHEHYWVVEKHPGEMPLH